MSGESTIPFSNILQPVNGYEPVITTNPNGTVNNYTHDRGSRTHGGYDIYGYIRNSQYEIGLNSLYLLCFCPYLYHTKLFRNLRRNIYISNSQKNHIGKRP